MQYMFRMRKVTENSFLLRLKDSRLKFNEQQTRDLPFRGFKWRNVERMKNVSPTIEWEQQVNEQSDV